MIMDVVMMVIAAVMVVMVIIMVVMVIIVVLVVVVVVMHVNVNVGAEQVMFKALLLSCDRMAWIIVLVV